MTRPAGFPTALSRFADDRTLRERLGANARETAGEHGLDRVGEQLAAIYRELVVGSE